MNEHRNDDGRTAPGVSRRSLLVAGAVGIPAVALTACSQAKAPASAAGNTSAAAGAGSSGAAPSAAGSSGAAPLAKLSDIKVGEAISATGPDGKPFIIARPTESTVAAFSAICTHQACTVAPAGKELDCPCHGSVYNATTGQVINGPAPLPLPPVKVTLSGDNVIAG